MTLKEQKIKEYIADINFKNEDFSISRMGKDMRMFLGEEPAIDVKYKKDVIVESNKSKEIKNIDKVEIVFYDTDNRFKKLEFKIDDNY